jgi:hypothetical protein
MADLQSFPSRFWGISTHRDLLGDALLQRYGRAIRGYLLAPRDKVLDGRLARRAPGQGRFRFHLETSVLHEARRGRASGPWWAAGAAADFLHPVLPEQRPSVRAGHNAAAGGEARRQASSRLGRHGRSRSGWM